MYDFTIVTPSYNYKTYVSECIDSVLAQEGVTYEHLVYDAESTDGTTEILKEYEDKIHLIVEKDSGMSEAINKGFKAAKGKWVMWLNTDDVLLPGALAKIKEIAEQSSDTDVIYGAWNFIDKDGKFIRRARLTPFSKVILPHNECYLGSTATFFRKATTIDEGHLLNEEFRQVMDGEYFLRLAKNSKKFTMLNDVIANFRMHGENISQKRGDKDDMSYSLKYAKGLAEATAIRRTYGFTFFKNPNFNLLVDGLLFLTFKIFRRVVFELIRLISIFDVKGQLLKSYHFKK